MVSDKGLVIGIVFLVSMVMVASFFLGRLSVDTHTVVHYTNGVSGNSLVVTEERGVTDEGVWEGASLKEKFLTDRVNDGNYKLYFDGENSDLKFRNMDLKIYNPVGTNSMLPLFGKGVECLTIAFEGQELFVGDVVSFETNYSDNVAGQIITHRIIDSGVDSEGFFYKTKGDNNDYVDPWVLRDSDLMNIVVGFLY